MPVNGEQSAFAAGLAARSGTAIRSVVETFTSTIFHLEPVSSRAGSTPLFLKTLDPAASPAVRAAFEWELAFYRTIYPLIPAEISPRLVGCSSADDAIPHLVLEDLSASHDSIDWPCPPTEAQVLGAVRRLAHLHVFSCDNPGVLDTASALFRARAPGVPPSEEGDAFMEFLSRRIESDHLAAIRHIRSRPYRVADDRQSLLLGDAHFWNVLYPRNGDATRLVDWQDWRVGPPVVDLAYMLSLGVCPSVRTRRFRAHLFDEYCREWRRRGGPPLDDRALWEEMISAGLSRAVQTVAYQWSARLPAIIWTRSLFTLLELPEFIRLRRTLARN